MGFARGSLPRVIKTHADSNQRPLLRDWWDHTDRGPELQSINAGWGCAFTTYGARIYIERESVERSLLITRRKVRSVVVSAVAVVLVAAYDVLTPKGSYLLTE